MAEWLRAIDPALKILFTSGYTKEAIARQGAGADGVEFLAKPYTLTTLTGKVREMLDR
jgi:FixJ family two-component response regulator